MFEHRFDWDPVKARNNRRKHGVEFELATTVFDDHFRTPGHWTRAAAIRIRPMRPEYDFSGGERGRFFHRNATSNLPVPDASPEWVGPDGDLGACIAAGAFGNDDPEKVVAELQHMQVLARADHQTVDGGRFSLNAVELEQMRTEPEPPWLPGSVEDRIARDSARTNRIIEAYKRQAHDIDPNWPALVFATSVEHAQTIAALLGRTGVPSRAVSGETEPSTRRRNVEEFRRGELKVLVNYGVFREGFDAPQTRIIIVARPVYSPNLYFRMIGCGLRGTRNGGTDRCLVIDVQDNIDNFERRLAFTGLDWLWA